jgi:hypothetical protein
MALFYEWLGKCKTRGIRLAVMDMRKPFHNAIATYAPHIHPFLFGKTSIRTA